MKRRQALKPKAGKPSERLAAGPCIEVWGDGGPLESLTTIHTAAHRWKAARREWMVSQGLDPRDYAALPPELWDRRPYSLARWRAERRDYAAEFLAKRGLPRDWAPQAHGRPS